MFQITDYFDAPSIIRRGCFSTLDKVDGAAPSSLVWCGDESYLRRAADNENVSAILTTPALLDSIDIPSRLGVVVDDEPRRAFWALHNRLVISGLLSATMEFGRGEGCRIHPTAVVSPKSWIGDRVEIGPHAVVEAYSAIDGDSFIGPGAVVGAEGLQVFAAGEGATFVRHAGGVRLGRSVVLLANAVISKAVRPIFTEIGEYCSISLLTGIGHESRLGARCSLASNVVVGGSVIMKDDVWVGPSACIKDGVSIGARARILLGSVVVKDVADEEVLSGNFAIPHHRNLRRQAGSVR